MKIRKYCFGLDGEVTVSEREATPEEEAFLAISYVPTQEDRLSALESAMLSMMGVTSNV